jgi:pimeloyl-ACP methyl ester carboxylesterase
MEGAMAREGTVRLTDGRALGFAEYGNPDGKPILYFHGLPGSRFYELDHDALSHAGARLLTVERPGIGLSDPLPGRSLKDWPLDVAELADGLGLDRFGVLGTSAGGPYALATGLGLPERVTAVGLMCAVGPSFEHPEFDEGLPAAVQLLMPLARQDLEATIPLVHQFLGDERKKWEADPDSFFEDFVAEWPEIDRPAFQAAAPMWRKTLAATYGREGGYATDVLLVFGPWQLDLRALSVPLRAWHGSEDGAAQLGLIKIVVDKTDGELVLIPGQGHYIDAEFHAEIVEWFLDHS